METKVQIVYKTGKATFLGKFTIYFDFKTMTVILIIFILIIIVFLIYWRFKRDSLKHVQLENELKDYLIFQKMGDVRCPVKIYEPDTIFAFPLERKVFF